MVDESSEDSLRDHVDDAISYFFGFLVIVGIDFAIFYFAQPSFLSGAVRLVLTFVSFLYLLSTVIALHEVQKKAKERPRGRYLVVAFNVVAAVAFGYLLLRVAAWDLTVTYATTSDVFTDEFLERFSRLVAFVVKAFLGLVLFGGFMYSLNQISQIVLNREVDGNGA